MTTKKPAKTTFCEGVHSGKTYGLVWITFRECITSRSEPVHRVTKKFVIHPIRQTTLCCFLSVILAQGLDSISVFSEIATMVIYCISIGMGMFPDLDKVSFDEG